MADVCRARAGFQSLKVQPTPLLLRRIGSSYRRFPSRRVYGRRLTVVRLFGGGSKNEDAARRALEDALSDKKDAFMRWDEEIKKRGGDRGGGGGGGGKWGKGWFGWFENDSGKDIQQAILAVGGLFLMYLLLTKGMSLVIISINSLVRFLRLFRSFFESLASGRFKALCSGRIKAWKPTSVSNELNSDSKSAIANVVRKWGPD